ncbi:MAG: hypothetical protein ACTSWA_08465 [Candidatus Thorarchaeota archaeon]
MIHYKYRLTWENEEGELQAEFWLPKGENPKIHIGTLLNLVELDADDTGYAYNLTKIGEVSCD